jgi:hypothetical protein
VTVPAIALQVPVDFVAIDPGKLMLGLSFWEGRVLQWAGWVPVDAAPVPNLVPGAGLVIERPRARRPEDTPGGVAGYQALIDIAMSGAIYAGHCGLPVASMYPDEWKGGTSKTKTEVYIVERRCKELLSLAEYKRIELPRAKSKHHNVWDAVGLGLVALGRAGRGVTRRG